MTCSLVFGSYSTTLDWNIWFLLIRYSTTVILQLFSPKYIQVISSKMSEREAIQDVLYHNLPIFVKCIYLCSHVTCLSTVSLINSHKGRKSRLKYIIMPEVQTLQIDGSSHVCMFKKQFAWNNIHMIHILQASNIGNERLHTIFQKFHF